MNYPARAIQSLQVATLATEQTRQRLVSAIISCTNGTPFSLEPHQQQVLDRFKRGRLTLDEVVYYLEATAKPR